MPGLARTIHANPDPTTLTAGNSESAHLPQRWFVTRGIGPVDRRRALALGGCYVRAVPTITPEAALPLVETFCEVRNPDHLREEVRLECTRRGNSITISERRPPWRVDLGPEWTGPI